MITGAALGLPGCRAALRRRQPRAPAPRRAADRRDPEPLAPRRSLDQHITRLVKGDDGSAAFETIDVAEPGHQARGARRIVRPGVEEFGVDADRAGRLGRNTELAIAAGIDALRDAGIPLVLHYKDTTTGSKLPDRWSLPEELRDDTGVIFASAFPGLEEMADELDRFYADRSRREQLATLESLRGATRERGRDRRCSTRSSGEFTISGSSSSASPTTFDRRFLFRVLSMGHSQFAELIGARGPNTQVNSACASTTQAVALAEDWIRAGRCRRVVIVAGDDATSRHAAGLDRRRLPRRPAPPRPTTSSRRRRCRSTSAATA